MKIAVGIPSLMESKNIKFITTQIDKGLNILMNKYPIIKECTIINIDSNSSDDTRKIFKESKTISKKISINVLGTPGKGKNILRFFREVINNGYDIALTLDADLKSIENNWVEDFIKPFINKESDFVTPIYERSRFEGSTTNHFAYPIIYSFSGLDIRQPIAGDFALSQGLIKFILKQNSTKNIKKYGIDIFETISASLYSKKIKEIKLKKKIHNPSFSKLELMFPQVASSAVDAIRNLNIKELPNCQKQNSEIGITSNIIFPHKKNAKNLLERQKKELLRCNLNNKWLGNIKSEIKKNINNKNFYYSKDIWSEVLSDWMVYAIKNTNKSSSILAKELLPYSVFRTVHFWNKIVSYSSNKVEEEIREQAKMIREKINNKLFK